MSPLILIDPGKPLESLPIPSGIVVIKHNQNQDPHQFQN
jgi:hypothetical protein